MRVLSALVLTHCFGCVIPEDSDEEFIHRYSISDLDRRDIADGRYGRKILETTERISYNQEEPGLPDVPGKNPRLAGAREAGTVYLLPAKSLSNINKRENGTQVEAFQRPEGKVVLANRSAPLNGVSERGYSKTKRDDENWEAKGDDNSRLKGPLNENRWRSTGLRSHGLTKRQDEPDDDDDDNADSNGDDTEDESDVDNSEWDEWAEWSECSTSCGCGRQVRWRHCVGNECSNGLKRAEIRTCHLRDCNNKNLFSWLGVKA
ncbi:uncharacterized protein LOC125500735 [Athalia rosae]|uniref:uncharacterized protein LOC125500735 n=1 Tax=Athalia rosae TaxID=37344 RepID=UPI002033822E|nr:uncharacterized protein LOC125500735 [Athalia rosae]